MLKPRFSELVGSAEFRLTPRMNRTWLFLSLERHILRQNDNIEKSNSRSKENYNRREFLSHFPPKKMPRNARFSSKMEKCDSRVDDNYSKRGENYADLVIFKQRNA